MGLFSHIKNPVSGTAQVVGCEPPPTTAMKAPCRMQLVVQASGIAPFSCEQVFEVWAGKWPSPGDTLPVTFDRDHTDRMRVEWDQVGDAVDQARADADQLAVTLRAQHAGAPAAPGVPGVVPSATVITMGSGQPMQIVGANSDQAKAAIAKAEAKLGMDLDGDGTVAGAPAGPGQKLDVGALMAQAQAAMAQFQQGGGFAGMPGTPAAGAGAAAPGPPDTIAELERLGDLRDRGALTDAEFEQQKQRILGSG